MQSPTINLGGHVGKTPVLRWSHFLHMAAGDPAWVEVSNNGGFTWSTAFSGTGNVTGDTIHHKSVVLSSEFATSDFRVRFRIWGFRNPSIVSHEWGFYIDNVSVDIPDDNLTPQVFTWVDDGESLDWPDGGFTDDTTVTYKTTNNDKLVDILFQAGTTCYLDGSPYTGTFDGVSYMDDWYDAEEYGFPDYDDIEELDSYEVGGDDDGITFDKPVRILIPGDAGKSCGWSEADEEFFPIVMLDDDDGSLLDGLGVDEGYLYVDANGDGVIDENDDLAIWTNHLSYYLTYVPEPATLSLLILGGLVFLRRRRR